MKTLMKNLVPILLTAVFVLIVTLSFVYMGMRNEDAYTETLECQVVDKYYHSAGRGGTSFHIVIEANGKYAEIKDSIQVAQKTFYENVKVGDTIACTITYDEYGILNAEVESWD